jgi:hypothetical protein
MINAAPHSSLRASWLRRWPIGTDLLRIEDHRSAEYWVNSDVHVLLAQLAVHA